MISTEATEHIDRPPEEVFTFVTDPTNEPRWHTDVIEAKSLTTGVVHQGSRWRWLLSFMGRKEQVMEVTRVEPNRFIELRGGEIMGLTPTITYRIEPEDAGTRFTRRIEMETRGVGKVFSPILNSERGAEHNHTLLTNLKRELENATT